MASRRFNLLGLALVVVALLLAIAPSGTLSLDHLAGREQELRTAVERHPVGTFAAAWTIYVGVTGLSIPGATALTLVYAWLFGFWPALLLVSLASTTGATLAFVAARYLLRDLARRSLEKLPLAMRRALEEDSSYYLFSLRLVPLVPFFAINLLMGLTPISVARFWWVSQLGMAPGTAAYVYAGSSVPALGVLANPARLQPRDISEPRAFAIRLVEHGPQPGTSSEHLLWRQLARAKQEQLSRAVGASSAVDDHSLASLLVEALNENLTARAFLVHARDTGAAHDAPAPHGDRDATHTDSANPHIDQASPPADINPQDARQTQAANRQWLAASFPTHVAPQQPLVPRRLLAALCVVGLFPLAIKRLLAAINSHRQRATREQSSAETAHSPRVAPTGRG